MIPLELLAPARTADIGIAAIRCGADAVYIGGPHFGARLAAGNSINDIARLTAYASHYGVKIFVTVNTLARDGDERRQAVEMMKKMRGMGISAFILQDTTLMPLLKLTGEWKEEFHASTQCAIRTPERALQLVRLGFSRLILERQLSLEQIRAIRRVVPPETELEFFVHGAACVCYSGDCYLSEFLTGRSANRGECAQPCRNLYNLTDGQGRILVKNKPLLSLKDLSLATRINELIDAGITSFKIEGRLKNESYVKNAVKAYSDILDGIVGNSECHVRSSWGKTYGGFNPDTSKTFNRGYTSLFLDGTRGEWNSPYAAGGLGEPIGKVTDAGKGRMTIMPDKNITVHNGDGLCHVADNGEIVGFRVEKAICESCGGSVQVTVRDNVRLPGKDKRIWRNYDNDFERSLQKNMPQRFLHVTLSLGFNGGILVVEAEREDGVRIKCGFALDGMSMAQNQQRMRAMTITALSKRTDFLEFSVGELRCDDGYLPLMSSAFLNSVRRQVAVQLTGIPVRPTSKEKIRVIELPDKQSCLEHPMRKGELMRSRYCIRAELGMCLKKQPTNTCRLFLENNGKVFPLNFDCRNCEMTVNMPTCR